MTQPHKLIYMDYQSTTPCDPRVVDKMMPYLTEHFGNPHSSSHVFGWQAEDAVEEARTHIADLIGAEDKDIIFTSGATESNNLALKGLFGFYGPRAAEKAGGEKAPLKNHMITCVTEHKCVLEAARHLEQHEGIEVTYLPVQKNGLLDLDVLKGAIKDTTLVVSIMAVNNEIGVMQPIEEIGAICRERGVFFHTDAAQAAGKIPLNVEDMKIDLLSISAHKMYGPKGVGALYVRRKKPRVRLQALLSGGGQERGMRSGTLSPALCAGFGEACRIAKACMADEYERLLHYYTKLMQGIVSSIDEVYLNGDAIKRFPGNLNLSFAYVEGEGLMGDLCDIALSSGSACTSASLEPSYVLKALGVSEELAHTSLRFGLGRFTTEEEVDYVIEKVQKAMKRLRDLSPLYEMVKEGVDITKIQWDHH